MRHIVLAALAAVATAGCATTGSIPAEQAMHGGSATLNGVITLPEQATAGASNPCEGLVLRAFRTADPSKDVGKVTVRNSRGRCSYQVAKIPNDSPVALELKSEGWACATGSTLTLTPGTQPILYGAHESRTKDFAATCATASSEQPSPNAG
ncbi:MAG: hypothetical protein L0Y66_01985 [Myxococcaceae bacterium]|nr:hypothetical protein [Myxococcaceae bacterium]MCI0673646.1 hypothetical protein [Myxococcaceae bacterium]